MGTFLITGVIGAAETSAYYLLFTDDPTWFALAQNAFIGFVIGGTSSYFIPARLYVLSRGAHEAPMTMFDYLWRWWW